MKLEKFLEKDIKEWLDEVADQEKKRETPGLMREEEIDVFDLTKDYSKEVRIALDKGDLEQARNIYLQLRKEYETFNDGSGNQKRAYRILREIRMQIKDYLESLPESVITPREPEKLGILMPPNPEKPHYDIPPEELARLEREKEELTQQMREKITQLERHLQENEVVEAVEIYRDVKADFMKFPDVFKDDRKELYDEVLTAYYQIRKAAERLERYEREYEESRGQEIAESLEKVQELQAEHEEENLGLESEPEEATQELQDAPEKQAEPEVPEGGEVIETQAAEDEDATEEVIEEDSLQIQDEQTPQTLPDKSISVQDEPEVTEESVAEESPPPPPPHLKEGAESEIEVEDDEDVVEDEETKHKILEKIDAARRHIKQKQIRKAFGDYKEAKHLFKDFEASREVKEELFKDLLGVYHSLTELENHMMEHAQRPRNQESMIKQEDEPGLLEKINKAKVKAYKYLDNEEVESAIIQYDKLRELFDQIPEDMEDDKERLHRELMGLHDDIVEMKKKSFRKEEVNPSQAFEEIDNINQHIKEGDLESAKKEFLELQHKTLNVKDEDKRKELYRALDSIKNKLNMAESTQNMEKRAVEA